MLSANAQTPQSIKQEKYELEIVRNYVQSSAMVYLLKNKLRIDSLAVYNLDFRIDSLISFDDTLWHYMFSICSYCDSLSEIIIQLVFVRNNDKMQIAYLGDYLYTTKLNLDVFPYLPMLDTNEFFNIIKVKYRTYKKRFLHISPKDGEHYIELIYYSAKSGFPEEIGLRKKFKLKYDNKLKIFYTDKKKINTICTFELEINGKQIKKNLHNVIIYMLKDYEVGSYAYYKGNWYLFFDNFFRPMNIIYKYCDLTGCIQIE
jgi:hypothetical protein